MYTITAKSCCAPRIEISLEGNLYQVLTYRDILLKSFRQIEIVDNTTGELMWYFYESDQLFIPEQAMWQTLGEVEDQRVDFLSR